MGTGNRKATSEILWRLSTNLRTLRKARGYTQRELAQICGFSNTYISNVEQGTINITLANLETLARGLDCAEEDLLRRPLSPSRRYAEGLVEVGARARTSGG